MSLKAKIIERFKAKFPNLNLSKERLDAMADRMDAKITEESQIDEKLDELNEINPFEDIAKLEDRVRNAERIAKEKVKGKEPKEKEKEPEPKEELPKENDDTPAWAKALLQEVSALKADKVKNSRKDQVLAKLKDADDKYKSKVLRDFERMRIETDEDFEAVLADVEADLKEHTEIIHLAKFGKDKPFGGIGGNGGKTKEASKEEVQGVLKNIL